MDMIIKKSIIGILSFIIMMMCICIFGDTNVYASETLATGTCGDNAKWAVTDDHTLIIEGTGETYDYAGDNVVMNDGSRIKQPWINYRSYIKSVVFKEGITSIGVGFCAFTNELEKVTIPSSVKTIDHHAFLSCEKIQSIVIPQGVTAINDGAFCACENLTCIELPETLESLGVGTFMNCSKLQSVSIPDKVKVIKWGLFYNDNGLEQVTFSDTITKIENEAFLGCSRVSNIHIPDTVEEIGKDAFFGCFKLWDIQMPERFFEKESVEESFKYTPFYLKSVGGVSGANGSIVFSIDENGVATVSGDGNLTQGFLNTSSDVGLCYGLVKKVIIKGNISTIDSYAFRGFMNLREAEILCNTKLDYYAFSQCEELSQINIGENVSEISKRAFSDCQNFQKIVYEGTYSGWQKYNLEPSDINNAEVICKKKDASTVTLNDKTVCYTGEVVTINVAEKTGSTSDVTYKYYYDENCSNEMAAPPSEIGVYYVKAYVDADSFYDAAESNLAGLTIQEHKWNSTYTVDKKATYAATGSKSIHCSVCDTIKPNSTVSIPKQKVTTPTVSKPTAVKKGFTVKWKKVTGANGYEIQYALNNKFTKGKKTVKITKAKAVSKKVTNLKAKKKYYVRVRAYKTVSGKNYYSTWSKAKSVTTKK